MDTFIQFLTELQLQYHSELNPKLWSGFSLHEDIDKQMFSYAKKFQKYCQIPNNQIIDIYFTGGNANFNYTDKSDIDIHLIVDKSKLKYTDDYYWDMKKSFMIDDKTTISSYLLEPYVQDTAEQIPKNEGVYSILYDKWKQQPKDLKLNFENKKLIDKIETKKQLIDSIISDNLGKEKAQLLKKKITSSRGSSIKRYGEFATNNLIFKELRNEDYLDKLDDYINK